MNIDIKVNSLPLEELTKEGVNLGVEENEIKMNSSQFDFDEVNVSNDGSVVTVDLDVLENKISSKRENNEKINESERTNDFKLNKEHDNLNDEEVETEQPVILSDNLITINTNKLNDKDQISINNETKDDYIHEKQILSNENELNMSLILNLQSQIEGLKINLANSQKLCEEKDNIISKLNEKIFSIHNSKLNENVHKKELILLNDVVDLKLIDF